MRAITEYKLGTESDERRLKRGRCNDALVLIVTYKRRKYIAEISSGHGDDIDFWRDGDELIVLSVNRQMYYCGFEVFVLFRTNLDDIEPEKYCRASCDENIFLQGTEQVEHVLGKDALDRLTMRTIAKRLYNLV